MKKVMLLFAVPISNLIFSQAGINMTSSTKILKADGEVRVRHQSYKSQEKVDDISRTDSGGNLKSNKSLKALNPSGLNSEGQGKWKLYYGIFHKGMFDFEGNAYQNKPISFSVLWDNTCNHFKVLSKTEDIIITEIDGNTIALNDTNGKYDTITIDFNDIGSNWVEITSERNDKTLENLEGTFVIEPNEVIIGDFPE